MREPSDFLRWVLPYAHGCPDPVAEAHIISAARDFCMATRCWRERDCIDVTGEEDEILCVPPYATLFELEKAEFDGQPLERVSFQNALLHECGEPSQITQVEAQSVAVAPRGACGSLSVSMFLMPAQNAEVLPDFLYELHGELIGQGALGTILAIPGQPYSNPSLATYNAALFTSAKASRFNLNVRGQQRAPVRTRSRFL